MDIKIDAVANDDFVMDYCCFGNGDRPFVIIPGVSPEPVTPMAEFVSHQYRKFHAGYKCYLFDRKRNFPADYSVEQMADDTAQAMRQLGISDACVFGSSQGGMIAMVLAAKYPDLVRKLALGSSAAYIGDFARDALQQWVGAARQGDTEALISLFFEKIYSDDFRAKNAKALALAAKMVTNDAIPRLLTLCNACLDYDGRAFARRIQCESFVLGSRQDNVLGHDSQDELARLLQCRSKIYDGYSHLVYDETPEALAHVLAFFDE